MSLVAARSSDERIQNMNAPQIGRAAKAVFEKLASVVVSDSPFDYNTSRKLRKESRRFAQAVQHQLSALDCTTLAIGSILASSKRWDENSAQSRVRTLYDVDTDVRQPRQHFLDSLCAFTEAKTGISAAFDQYIKAHGAKAVIELTIESRGASIYHKHDETLRLSARELATDLIKNIELLETNTRAIHEWLAEMVDAAHCNLQDENTATYFYAPLAECPFWSDDCQSELEIDCKKISSVQSQLACYASEFKNVFPTLKVTPHEDFLELRKKTPKPPEPKVVIPQPEANLKQKTYPVVPRSVLVGHIPPPCGGSFEVSLEGFDKFSSKTSRVIMKMEMQLPAHNVLPLREVAVRCQFYPTGKDNPLSTSLLCISDCFPQRAIDLNKDPGVLPYNCNADLELKCSLADLLEWRLSRRLSMWDWVGRSSSSVIPTQFPFSFNLSHTVDMDVEVEVEFTCQARWSKSTHHLKKAKFSLPAL
ncbi:hypothetical protein BJ165DRAFT_1615915 [Panaeolus papilionaceus]|nr:hypothetical protein BJ165DRAFT_1615915 [Panaeolus papilionaceus]